MDRIRLSGKVSGYVHRQELLSKLIFAEQKPGVLDVEKIQHHSESILVGDKKA